MLVGKLSVISLDRISRSLKQADIVQTDSQNVKLSAPAKQGQQWA